MFPIHNPRFRKVYPVIATGILLVLASCAGGPSTLAPASYNAQQIYTLTLIIFAIAAVVFIAVEGVMLYAAIRYSRDKTTTLPRQIEGNTRLELAWTALPAIVLIIIFFVMLRVLMNLGYQPSSSVGSILSPVADTNKPIYVKVVGHQWWWEFDYPDMKIVTANELHVPINTVINFDVESVDVIHSYWVPELGGKMDAIPGHTNKTWFLVSKVGEYYGQCAEYCGAQHAGMRLRVIAETTEQFQAWAQQQQAAIPANLTGDAAKGEQTFMSGACIGCHTINGTNAKGTVGPNLTHFASRGTFAGGMYENNQQNVSAWLANPPGLKPGTLMPNLNLSQDQINALVAFLESLK